MDTVGGLTHRRTYRHSADLLLERRLHLLRAFDTGENRSEALKDNTNCWRVSSVSVSRNSASWRMANSYHQFAGIGPAIHAMFSLMMR